MSKSPFKNIDCDPDELVRYLKKYTDDIMGEINKAQRKVGNKARKKLKETSPYREDVSPSDEDKSKSKKHYRDSWTIKREYTGKFAYGMKLTILSKSKPHLTHLLENGHRVVLEPGKEFKKSGAKRQVSARKHIEPVQEEANIEFQQAIDEILRRHGK